MDGESDVKKLQQLFKVTQSVMNNRHNMVEESMAEAETEAKNSKKRGQYPFLVLCWWLLSVGLLDVDIVVLMWIFPVIFEKRFYLCNYSNFAKCCSF